MSGTPCLTGTRIPVYMVSELVYAEGVDEAIDMWELTRGQVLVACWYAGAYGAMHLWAEPDSELELLPDRYRDTAVSHEWLDRWRDWAQQSARHLWNGSYDKVTDPPRSVEAPA